MGIVLCNIYSLEFGMRGFLFKLFFGFEINFNVCVGRGDGFYIML